MSAVGNKQEEQKEPDDLDTKGEADTRDRIKDGKNLDDDDKSSGGSANSSVGMQVKSCIKNILKQNVFVVLFLSIWSSELKSPACCTLQKY